MRLDMLMLDELPFLFAEIESEQVNYLCCPLLHSWEFLKHQLILTGFELVLFFKLVMLVHFLKGVNLKHDAFEAFANDT